jgi:hypothetical protein
VVWTAEELQFESRQGQAILIFVKVCGPALEPSQLACLGTGGFFSGVQRPGREADLQQVPRLRMKGFIPLLLHIAIMAYTETGCFPST